MAYINQPPDLRVLFSDLDQRLRKLELAQRFTAPDVATVPTYPRVADIVYDNTVDQMKYWDGVRWVVFADNNVGSPLIPYTATWSGTGLAFTGTPALGQYMRIGKLIHFQITVSCATVTNFGTGQYSVTLPTGLAPNHRTIFNGGITRSSGAVWNIEGFGITGSTTFAMGHPTSNGGTDIFSHNRPITLATTDVWYINGQYFIA